ncbi:tryptophan 7-halogenase [Microvirga lotononidis]|uniref:Flavin-dependent dehydrogenase n=1 Tax=Microvirga lotononidis TaxID=864069 RepID=I4Z4K7_9HYPH|nr:tryptophan 7-halogenase [Microvirga lotononidis]EIM31149.1 flavin-dependent dehydrogenase [Microvirga lotononidis]WQO30459.1 tryptophan 7-halogenase [Microvirga lotononidis]
MAEGRAPQWDAAVVGAGAAGLAAAGELARLGRSVVVLDGDGMVRRKPGEVLTPNAVPSLAALGLLDELAIDNQLAMPLLSIQRSWAAETVERDDLLMHPGGRGWSIDRLRFEALLASRAAAAGAVLSKGIRVDGLDGVAGQWRLSVGAAGRVEARFLVDASGRPAVLARRLGARLGRPKRLLAIHAFCRLAEEVSEAAHLSVAAAPDGWWYAVEVPQRSFACGYLFAPSLSSSSASDPRRRLLQACAEAGPFALRIQRVVQQGEICLVDASSSLLDKAAGEGWIAVGDAAASFDPLASQGLANALASGLAGGRAAHRALCGDNSALPAYAAAIRATWQHSHARLVPIYSAVRRWPEGGFWTFMSTHGHIV